MGDFPLSGESLALGYKQKWTDLIFWLSILSPSGLNTVNSNLFRNHGRIYRFDKKFNKYCGEINPLGAHSYIGGWRKFHAKPVCFLLFSGDKK